MCIKGKMMFSSYCQHCVRMIMAMCLMGLLVLSILNRLEPLYLHVSFGLTGNKTTWERIWMCDSNKVSSRWDEVWSSLFLTSYSVLHICNGGDSAVVVVLVLAAVVAAEERTRSMAMKHFAMQVAWRRRRRLQSWMKNWGVDWSIVKLICLHSVVIVIIGEKNVIG